MRNARASFVVFLCLAACHAGPSEPTSSTAPAESAPQPLQPAHRLEAHHIIERDHRHVVPLRVDDRVVLPNDPAFDWRVDFEDRSAFVRVADTDAEAASETYRVTKAGPFRMMVYGDPKCLKTDAKCGLSKRRWDVTVAVQ